MAKVRSMIERRLKAIPLTAARALTSLPQLCIVLLSVSLSQALDQIATDLNVHATPQQFLVLHSSHILIVLFALLRVPERATPHGHHRDATGG